MPRRHGIRGHGPGPFGIVWGGRRGRNHRAEGRHEGGGPCRDAGREVRSGPGRVPRDGGHGHHREGPVRELPRTEGLRVEQLGPDRRGERYQNFNWRNHVQKGRRPEAYRLAQSSWSCGGWSLDLEARIKSIIEILDQLAEDTSVPRNIRRGAADAKTRLLKKDDALDLRVQSAIIIMAHPVD